MASDKISVSFEVNTEGLVEAVKSAVAKALQEVIDELGNYVEAKVPEDEQ